MEHYKVVKKIGVGTYGSACLACLKRDPSQLFVLKKVKVDEDNDKERHQAEMEVTVLSKLDHPLVLRYIDHFMYKGHLCIITEYCEAGDLYGWLRSLKTAPPEGQVLDWLVQVTMAVQYVHANNILHRDLKTQNIFLTHDGCIRLGDFGISRPLKGAMDLASTLVGTPYYMSPEVMSSQPYNFKSDMWSLGCCLYEMMSLKHAFDASDMNSLVLKIMRGQHLPISQQFSPELRDLTKQLLNKNPKQRPSPDALLKLPWLKEYVARAHDKVRALREQRSRSPYRHGVRPSMGVPPSLDAAKAHRPPGAGPEAGGAGGEGALDTLDKELEAAKQKLQRIQAERDALQLAAMNRGAGGPSGARTSPMRGAVAVDDGRGGGAHAWAEGGGGRPSHVSASTGPHFPPAGSADGGFGYAAGLARGNDPAAAAAAARGPSPLRPSDRRHPSPLQAAHLQQQMQQLQLQHEAAAQQQLLQQQQLQQQQVPDAAALARMDPKMRKEVKRQLEIQQREAELLQARKAYFQVRKQAEAKKWHMIHGETNTAPAGAINEGTANPGGYQGMPAHHHSRSEGDDNSSRQPHSIQQGPYAAWQGSNGDGDSAAAEFEEELQRGGDFGRGGGGRAGAHANPMLLNVLGSTGGGGVKAEGPASGASPPTPSPAQRAAAVRELCVSALGPVLFEVSGKQEVADA
ncbi:kinase-like domain-containing protein [Dunaliella salina]|uniref:non-specific serine/threonine protein kinase n=1 Tax=Dunaliella salina TaxID=3046 RepID=A0ABQ7GBD7_DUNSA|nr:kinase-like domain-containing protein [Dunaliella salina]|eukprot:KAF5831908.1 kinase-like domain-containing protein [Dunaliella salina]